MGQAERDFIPIGIKLSRREFLKSAGAVAGGLMLPDSSSNCSMSLFHLQEIQERIQYASDDLLSRPHRSCSHLLTGDIRIGTSSRPIPLTRDIWRKTTLQPIPQTPEPPPLTEEDQEEIKELHENIIEYWQAHPEIKEQHERVVNKLRGLGFETGSLEKAEEDPTPTKILQLVNFVELLAGASTERVTRAVLTDELSLEDLRYYTKTLNGDKKARVLSENKEPQYWQPQTVDEEIIIEMAKKTMGELLGEQAGHFVVTMSYVRAEAFEEDEKDPLGSVITNGAMKFRIADNCDRASTDLVQELASVKDSLETSRQTLTSQADENEVVEKALEAARLAIGLADLQIRFCAEEKAGLSSQVLRHEIFGHLIDPLLFENEIYTFEDQLDALEIITDYLANHPELTALPTDYQGDRSPNYLWKDVFDIPHVWADIVTEATNHDWMAGDNQVSPEEIELTEKILAKTELDLGVEKIKQVYEKAFEVAVASMVEDCKSQENYQELLVLFHQIETEANILLGRPTPTAIPAPTEIPTPVPTEGAPQPTPASPCPPVGLMALATGFLWISKRRKTQGL